MSQPNIPDKPDLTREDVVNIILASIGMEELGLSHILNAEGEKLQYVMGTTEGMAGLDEPATIEDILDVNKSVRQTLSNATRLQMMLNTKMETAMSAPTMQGPPGPTGPKGEQGPTGPAGPQGSEGPRGPQGPQGIQGIAGTVGTIKGSYNSELELRNAHPDGGNPGDFYYINPNLWVWDEDNNDWVNVGEIAGPQGLQGIQGERGDAGPAGPTGPRGEQGPTGSTGPKGDQGLTGLKGDQGPTGLQGPKGETGPTGPPGAPVEVHNFNLYASGSSNEVTVGNIIFRLSNVNNTSISLSIRPASSPVLIDFARSSTLNILGVGSVENQYQNNFLLSTSYVADAVIYSQSNEQQKSWLRQRSPDGTWSLCEYSIFASESAVRVTLWINWIYKNLQMP